MRTGRGAWVLVVAACGGATEGDLFVALAPPAEGVARDAAAPEAAAGGRDAGEASAPPPGPGAGPVDAAPAPPEAGPVDAAPEAAPRDAAREACTPTRAACPFNAECGDAPDGCGGRIACKPTYDCGSTRFCNGGRGPNLCSDWFDWCARAQRPIDSECVASPEHREYRWCPGDFVNRADVACVLEQTQIPPAFCNGRKYYTCRKRD